jgi:antitoxin (DNA-binding transcriptional repressor) of toxin-antitoxin stability system
MAATATIRTLRNDFRRVRKLIEQEGEVVVTDHGAPRYRLTRYTPGELKAASPKDYMARLRRHQPHPLRAAAARALEDDNRGDR